jgi:outer membrane immunogenic protein
MHRYSLPLFVAALGLSFGLSGPASAADLVQQEPVYSKAPPALAPTWTGFYLGFNGGWGWTNSVNTTLTPTGATSIADITPQFLGENANGALFGGQIGFNWQFYGPWVLGVEGDFDGTGISRTQQTVFPSLLSPSDSDAFSATENTNWLASARARVGYAWAPGAGLFYITGGGAWERTTTKVLVSANTGFDVFGDSDTGDFSTTNSGWVVGAGYEWMVTPNWIVRGEYLFYDFNKTNINSLALANDCAVINTCGVNVSNTVKDINTFRLGVSYKFWNW